MYREIQTLHTAPSFVLSLSQDVITELEKTKRKTTTTKKNIKGGGLPPCEEETK